MKCNTRFSVKRFREHKNLHDKIFKVSLDLPRNCQVLKRNSALWRHYDISTTRDSKKPESQVALLSKFYRLVPKNLGPSPWNVLHIAILLPKILKWLLDFFKNLCTCIWDELWSGPQIILNFTGNFL